MHVCRKISNKLGETICRKSKKELCNNVLKIVARNQARKYAKLLAIT